MSGGTDAIRAALKARMNKAPLANLGRDFGVSNNQLELFVAGTATLPPQVLQALAAHIFGSNVLFDAEHDLLRRVGPKPTSLGVKPPSVPEMGLKLPTFTAGAGLGLSGLRSSPKPKRPGWAE